MLHRYASNDGGLLRYVRLVQRNELRGGSSSNTGKADVRVRVREHEYITRGSIGIVNSNVQVHDVSVAVDLLIGLVAVQVGDGAHHRIGFNMHIGDAVAAVNSLEVELEVADGIANIAHSINLGISVRQVHRRYVAVHGRSVPHRNPHRIIIIIGGAHFKLDAADTVGTINALQCVSIVTGSNKSLASPIIRQFVAADKERVIRLEIRSNNHSVNNDTVATINGLKILTQHIDTLCIEGFDKTMLVVGSKSAHRIHKGKLILGINLDGQIDDAIQTMNRLHRNNHSVLNRGHNRSTCDILHDRRCDEMHVVVHIGEIIGAKLNTIIHMEILRIDMHHQSVAIKHGNRMTTGQTDLTVNRTVHIGGRIQLRGIIAIPLQNLIRIHIGTGTVPSGNHLQRHTGSCTQTDKARSGQRIHMRCEGLSAKHVITQSFTVKTDRSGSEIAHIVNRRQSLAAVRTVIQLDRDTTHGVLIFRSMHIHLEGIPLVKRTGNSSKCGLRGRHHPVNNLDGERIRTDVDSWRINSLTPSVDRIIHGVFTNTVKVHNSLQCSMLKGLHRNIGNSTDLHESLAVSGHLTDNTVNRYGQCAVTGEITQSNAIAFDFKTDGNIDVGIVTRRNMHIVHLINRSRDTEIRIASLR